MMTREQIIAGSVGLLATVALAVMIVAGSRNLQHFDAALVCYTFAVLFAWFAVIYRYTVWLQRPPTTMYFKRGWQVFLNPRWLGRNIIVWGKRLTAGFAFNTFIWRRGKLRWGAHWLIMWGCVIAVGITFPLVFGWIHFRTVPGDVGRYRAFLFGYETFRFHTESPLAYFIFHGLVWASFLVIAGVMIAMRRRMRDRGAAALQQFGEDILPLLLLFAISVTGLMLWISYEWMHGYAFDFLAIIHAVTVIFTLLWLPFGKFFHIFQRPAQLGVSFYRDAGLRKGPATCARCGQSYAHRMDVGPGDLATPPISQMQVEDLITVERKLGYRYETPGVPGLDHYQRICPRCRRALLALTQGRMMRGFQHRLTAAKPTPAGIAAPPDAYEE